MGRLLINENPIMLLPKLAKRLGVNEAIILQQMHYWLLNSSHNKSGRKWIYNTYKDWQAQMAFWSEKTIYRTIKSMEAKGLVIIANFNRFKMDRTKWYSIDYEILETIEEDAHDFLGNSTGQNDQHNPSNCPAPEVDDLTKPIPEITETTTKTTTRDTIPFSEIISYLNNKTNSSFKVETRKTKDVIAARWKEGFRLKDFKKVIDLKSNDWLQDPKMNMYLRPVTLFGPKFESYLNQKSGKGTYREEDFDLHD